jgi:alpha-L-rhamnosidase
MAQIARALGKDGDAEQYDARAGRIRASLNSKMYDDGAGAYVDGLTADSAPIDHKSVHASVFPAAVGVPDSAAQQQRLASYVASRGMVCSVYCAGFLLKALYDGDRGQDALDLLTSHEPASWMNMILKGAGATGEAWDPSLKSNMTWSHPWAAAPAYVVPRDMYGIRPTAPGFARFDVRPQPASQTHGSVTVPSVRGAIGVAFHRVDGRTDLGVRVPGNSEATVDVPAAGSRADDKVFVDGRAVAGRREDGYLRVEVRPGCHTISVAADSRARQDPYLTEACSAQ